MKLLTRCLTKCLVKQDTRTFSDVEINPSEVPDYVIPNTEKLELEKLRTDIEKFYKSFSEEHKREWSTLLSADNTKWIQKGRAASWPLQDILARKANLRDKQKLPESDDNGLEFLGQKPEGVPVDVDDMVIREYQYERCMVEYTEDHNQL
ncbi:uncharacterized protein [Montipora foliosa]|uniref:uncharacterized protein n=1 Tax=Montipora foliosa TaxID=591990 RepID=UPI0035F1513B